MAGVETLHEGELLRWVDTEHGRAYRLERPDEKASIDYVFPSGVEADEVLSRLRPLLDSHRLRLRDLHMDR